MSSADQIKTKPQAKAAEHTVQVRRIITGHDENLNAVILEDQICPNRFVLTEDGATVLTELWKETELPANNAVPYSDPATSFTLTPPTRGCVIRTLEIPPNTNNEPPLLHTTVSVDYAIVLKGECYALVGEQETLMREGDVMIQRGTYHAWDNRSDKPCLIMFILCGAEPIPGLDLK